jgi:heterodisulfide reductase subunit C
VWRITERHLVMASQPHIPTSDSQAYNPLAWLVRSATGCSIQNCYQCGRCAAGCPQNLPGEMDISPTRIMRLLQLETAFAHEPQQAAQYAHRALSSDTTWLCAGCQACTTRCPQEIDIAATMDVLRQEALRRGVASASPRARDIQALHRTFVDGAIRFGRIHELALVMRYKLRTGHLFQDAMLGPAMFFKGKLRLLPGARPDTTRLSNALKKLKSEEGPAQ